LEGLPWAGASRKALLLPLKRYDTYAAAANLIMGRFGKNHLHTPYTTVHIW